MVSAKETIKKENIIFFFFKITNKQTAETVKFD
jgi:hypothetical protein